MCIRDRIRGTEGSSIFNGFIVFLKVSVILIFVILGWKYINTDNYTPYIPANTGVLGEYGFSGILRGAAIVFFAFLGFDAVSTAAQETKNPKRNMPCLLYTSIVAKLTKISPLKVEFAVPERYANDVKTGAGLDFTLEGKLNTFHATVYARESKIDPTTHTLTIRALYPNANGAVLPGRYASIKLNKDEIQDALAVPSEAIVPEMGKDKICLLYTSRCV